jgi:carbamoyl-phosphate synthase large subunit
MNPLSGPYSVMPNPILEHGDIVLRAVMLRDIEKIRLWRNAQTDVLRQNHIISKREQIKYFSTHVWPEKEVDRPNQILLSIEEGGVLIGYGGLVHIDWEEARAEISFLLSPSIERDAMRLTSIFKIYLQLIHKLAFTDLSLHRLTTETYSHRHIHIKVLVESGHKLEGVLREHVVINGIRYDSLCHGLLASEWRQSNQDLSRNYILLSSASSKVGMLRNLRTAASRLPGHYDVIPADADEYATSRFDATNFWHMPRLEELVLDDLIADCHKRDISIIFPSRDGELTFWASNKERLAEANITVVVPSVASVNLCLDKLAFAQFGADFGLPFIPASLTPDGFEGLLVVKERYGSGSKDIGIGLDLVSAIEYSRRLKAPLFQPMIKGIEISIDAWCDKSGVPVGVILRTRDRIAHGESQVTSTFSDPEIEKVALNALTALKLQGHVVMQGILNNNGLNIIECNPRFGGASSVAIEAGLDSLYWSLSEITGIDETPAFKRRRANIKQVRLTCDRYFYDYNLRS